jgi:hypothetical protein
VRDVDVVLNQISLRHAQLGPEELVEVGEPDDAVVNLNVKCFFGLWELDS